MDIIDVMLARALTPQGATETYVAIANAAAAKAEKAESDAEAAIATVEAASDTIQETMESADDLLAEARETLDTAQQALIDMIDIEDVDAEIKKMTVNSTVIDGQNAKTIQIISTYPDNTLNTQYITKLYKNTGNNEDGTMTQKAISEAIASSGGGGGSISFDPEDAGKLIVIDENGHAVAGSVIEEDLINTLVETGYYTLKDAVGLDMDYINKSMTRIQGAVGRSMGSDFNEFKMYGGRMRCNVADDGTINAFYGDAGYTEDGSNGQVMVYQPKFYYRRTPILTENISNGTAIRHEQLVLSDKQYPGFKVAPAFKVGDEELDYILLSAYEATVDNDKLTSIANTKPEGNILIREAEAKANARGTGWHITSLAVESTNQMLEMVEFGQMNGQNALEDGICNIRENIQVNCASLTGSTASLGNITGHATMTISEIAGTTTEETENGKRAISYRGVENPWGNMWHMLCDVNILGDGYSHGGKPYICTDTNYTPGMIGSNYEEIGFNLPSIYGWVSAMGQPNEKYDWVFLPAECASFANSLLPVGDNLWVVANVNVNKTLAVGGSYSLQENDGIFYYAADRGALDTARNNYGARLMFIPTKNNIYTTNITKWNNKMGG